MSAIDTIRSRLLELGSNDKIIDTALQELEAKLKLSSDIERTFLDSQLYLVYKHTAPDGRVYIGITKDFPNHRWRDGRGYDGQKKMSDAIQLMGWLNFTHEIIAAGLTEEEARRIEAEKIAEYNACDDAHGLNMREERCALSDSEQPDGSAETSDDVGPRSQKRLHENEIAYELMSEFSIQSISGKMCCLSDGSCRVFRPMQVEIEKLLVTRYNLSAQKRKNVLGTIRLLCTKPSHERDSQKTTQMQIIEDGTDKPQPKSNAVRILEAFFFDFDLPQCRNGKIHYRDLYERYVEWAASNSIKEIVPYEKTGHLFNEIAKATLGKKYPTLQKWRTGKGYGLRV